HGTMVFVVATATLTNDEGKVWTASAYARHADEQKGMAEAQITGSASSYARKYALNGLFLIDDTKDADTTNNGTKPSKKPEPKSDPEKWELDWLNPGTDNWNYAIKRIKETRGSQSPVTVETIQKSFRLSKENLT